MKAMICRITRAGLVSECVSGSQCRARPQARASASLLHLRWLRGAGWMAAAVDIEAVDEAVQCTRER